MNTHDTDQVLSAAVYAAVARAYDNERSIEDAVDEILDAIKADRKRRSEPECNHCGGTGDVSGEYPGIACPDCAGTGKAPQPATPVKVNAVFETQVGEVIGTTDAKVKRVEWQDDGSLTVVIDYWPQPAESIVSDVEAIVRLLESREWADHVATTPLGQRLETAVTVLVGADPQPSKPSD